MRLCQTTMMVLKISGLTSETNRAQQSPPSRQYTDKAKRSYLRTSLLIMVEEKIEGACDYVCRAISELCTASGLPSLMQNMETRVRRCDSRGQVSLVERDGLPPVLLHAETAPANHRAGRKIPVPLPIYFSLTFLLSASARRTMSL